MARVINVNDSITVAPSGYSSANSSYSSISSSYPVTNGYTEASSTNYAYITCNTGSYASTYISYTFNVSSIPENATIDSVTCTAKVRVSSTSYISSANVQLYNNTTAKGSATSARSTTSGGQTYTLTPGTWTRNELNNIQIRYTGTRGNSNPNRAAYLYFYGATLTINYSISGTAYSVIATSTVNDVIPTPATQELFAGETATVTIDAASIDDITVTDNGNDVTGSLVRHTAQSGTYTNTFIPSSFDSTNSHYDTTGGDSGNGVYSTNVIANGLTDHNSSTRCALYSVQGSNQQSYMYYNFDVSSIPANATITSVSCQFKGGTQGSSYYTSYTAQLCSGTTAKGTAQSVTGSNSSPSTVTINGGNSWTRAELENIKIKFQVTRGTSNTTTQSTWSFFGATLTVNYTVTPEHPYYWTYTLTNLSADHGIIIEQAGVYVPPVEDPEYTYHSLTISSINASTSPGTGTTRVIEGTNQTITITPSDPQLTLALDNGVDITSQLTGGNPTNTYTITTQVSGASYGFNLNSGTGYYVSTNNGVSKSASVARINCTFETACLVTIEYINYAEANYDYGMFGKLDTAVATDGLTAGSGSSSPSDSTSNYYIAMCSNSQNTQTVTYEVPAGNHFIDVKYGKDDASDDGNDSLQWKITSIQATGVGADYTYTLNNIQTSHSLIFVFGDVDYYFITSSGTNCRLFPDGQQVKLAGDSYLINIVPNDISDTVTLTDNNITQTLTREDGYDHNDNPIVSYQYTLTNIQANHTLVITSITNSTDIILYVKENGTWKVVNKVYSKSGTSWMAQNSSTWETFFSTSGKYVKG